MRFMDTFVRRSLSLPVGVGVTALLLSFASLHSHAAATAEKAASAAKRSKAIRIKHTQNHSGESQAERDRRLYRECKGMPNAGACLGYTRK